MALLQFEHHAMHTDFALFIDGEERRKAEGAAQNVWSCVDRLEAQFNRFITTSEVARIASLPPNTPTSVSHELMDCLVLSANLFAATNGCFDVTVGSLMDAWRHHNRDWEAIEPNEKKRAAEAASLARLELDPAHLRLSILPTKGGDSLPLELDFGGLAKGYAIDAARPLLEEEWEIRSYMIHGGTSTAYAVGKREDGSSWSVGMAGDWKARAGLDRIAVDGIAISGSGIQRKGEHIAVPPTRRAKRKHDAAWSCSTSAAVADALSTAFLLMDWSEIRQACDALDSVQAGAFVPIRQPHSFDRLRRPYRQTRRFAQLTRAGD